MEIKADFKCSDSSMRASFGAIESISEEQKSVFEKEISSLRSGISTLNSVIEDLEGKVDRLEEEKVAEYNKGFEKGKYTEYCDFWEAYQQGGRRIDYSRAFAGLGWTEDSFKPRYGLYGIDTATRMFEGTGIKNLTNLLIRMDKFLDLEGTTRTDYMFANCGVTRVPNLDLRAVINMEYMFYRAEELQTIDELVFTDDGSQEMGVRFFYRCYKLENINISGTIGCDVDIRHSPLLKYSIRNIIEHLSPDATGKTVWFSKAQVNKVFETSKGANDGTTSNAWLSLVATKPNWSITTV